MEKQSLDLGPFLEETVPKKRMNPLINGLPLKTDVIQTDVLSTRFRL